MPASGIGYVLAFECAEYIVVTGAMNARHLVSASLAEDEIQQQFLRMAENITADMERACAQPIADQPVVSFFVEGGEIEHPECSDSGRRGLQDAGVDGLTAHRIDKLEWMAAIWQSLLAGVGKADDGRLASFGEVAGKRVRDMSPYGIPSCLFLKAWHVLQADVPDEVGKRVA